MLYAEVIIEINHENVDKVFHYRVPEEMIEKIFIGMRIFVPFGLGNTKREGYIIGFTDTISIDTSLIKDILYLPENYQIFNENMIQLAKFISNKYYCLLSEALQCIMPKIVNLSTQKYVSINYENPDISDLITSTLNNKRAISQIKIIEYLQQCNSPAYIKTLEKKAGVSTATIKALEKKQIIKLTEKETKKYSLVSTNCVLSEFLTLNQEQKFVYDFIIARINLINNIDNSNTKKPIVLNGVTGSGKTEVYLHIIRDVIEQGKQAIVLVPEISLTPQTLDRFTSRFGDKVSITHSKLNSLERLEQWKKAKDGDISVMVGARSAIFTPFENLGVIIIDEEHEHTYKSETTPKYDAREIALKISELTGALVILGSATPSIESYYKASTGVYDLVHINNKTNNTPTDIQIVDMREELKNGNISIFSVELFKAIKYNLDNNLQTILFLNRRGHSTFVSCRECGHVLECDNCNINYTYHQNFNKLLCHYCDATIPIPNTCPNCNSKYIKYFGVGTQKIEENIEKYFKKARILRMDLDTTSTKNSHEKILNKFKNHEADILIGTQMIAKGLDFPKVSLVGVISADVALNAGNYKSTENCFQILTQVCGRSGRADIAGKAIIQTYMPEDFSIVLAKNNDYMTFYNTEISRREVSNYPPFSNIFFILITSTSENEAYNTISYLHSVFEYYNQKTNFELSDVAKASIYKIKNKFRYKIIIKAPNNSIKDEERLKNFVLYCVNILKTKKNVTNINISLSLNPNNIQ